jgi:hypothetical protein
VPAVAEVKYLSIFFRDYIELSVEMSDQPPNNALFVRWGKFQAGAFGIPAIVALALLASALFWATLH